MKFVDRDAGNLNLSDFHWNGLSFPDQSPAGWKNFMETGYHFSEGFVVTGTIGLESSFGRRQENSRVPFDFGHAAGSPRGDPRFSRVPEPAESAPLVAGATGLPSYCGVRIRRPEDCVEVFPLHE